MKKENCQIISVQASAGSGKTYSLAKRYISLLFDSSENGISLKNVIAVTFANKAAVEMKYRVVEYLKKAALSLDTDGIFDGFNISGKNLPLQSVKVLNGILDNYDSFNISTIDSFINSILKACAININISPNFKVEKDYSAHLGFALDSFLRNASTSPALKNMLSDYIDQYLLSEKTGWFPSNDIYNRAEKVFQKSSASGKGIGFAKVKFKEHIYAAASAIFKKTEKFYEICAKKDIYANTLKAVEKVLNGGIKSFFNPDKIPKAFAAPVLKYKKNSEPETAVSELWEAISFEIAALCEYYSENYYSVYSEIFSEIIAEFDIYAGKDELVFLNDINKKALNLFSEGGLIMPEVYYRLSEKYKYFLIDEFQDTNDVQWTVLKRFLEESLAGGGTFFYVGDPKQAIYDFRGGNSELFYKAAGDFSGAECDVLLLKENYRSHKTIVDFNNEVFSQENIERYLKQVYEGENVSEKFKDLLSVYASSRQNASLKKDKGYVEINIVPEDCEDEEEYVKEQFLSQVTQIANRFKQSDITVLCRSNDEAQKASGWLMAQNYAVESAQTLNIRNNIFVKEIFSLIKFIDLPINSLFFSSFILGEIFSKASRIKSYDFERFLFEQKKDNKSEAFYKIFRQKHEQAWNNFFEEFFVKAGFIPVYELALSILEKFKIVENFPESKPFVMRFLELIKDFEQEKSGIKDFTEYFETLDDKDESLYIKSASGAGIKVMTVHKAKGLQFPVVIVPFLKLSETKIDKPFFALDGNMIKLLYLTRNSSAFSAKLEALYDKEKSKTLMSEMNILYVSMTRAEKEFYALVPGKSGGSKNTAQILFQGMNLTVGKKEKYESIQIKLNEIFDESASGYKDISVNLESNKVDINSDDARRKGLMAHFALSQIYTLKNKNIEEEILKAAAVTKSKYLEDDVKWLEDEMRELFSSPDISKVFGYDSKSVSNEKEIIDSSGNTLRIDKLIELEKEVLVFDFKSSNGLAAQNKEQILNYADCLAEIYPGKSISPYIIDLSLKQAIEVKDGI